MQIHIRSALREANNSQHNNRESSMFAGFSNAAVSNSQKTLSKFSHIHMAMISYFQHPVVTELTNKNGNFPQECSKRSQNLN